MTPVTRKLDDYWVVIVAVLVAMLLAAHQLSQSSLFGVAGSYVYWLCRILIEAGCFFAVLIALEKYAERLLPWWGGLATAILVSLIPFTLAITALDLIIGLPELGLNGQVQSSASRLGAFALELLYLFDNHIALCLLLFIPRVILAGVQGVPGQSNQLVETADQNNLTSASFFESLDTPLAGEVNSIEAQEHYIRIQTTQESRMVLYRFSDAVKHIPASRGMQVHRSHWVADSAVKALVVKGQSMKLTLHDGSQVPVSRTFRAAVEQRYEQLLANSDR